ncbi:hypothetical protein OHT59_21595 [Streptomyces sp. NBC_00243]|uniref:hypothetical protein n=1 Tax=Streptomyces sp. NBC_00243 TaxID=2975688 RepID=UPI002DDB4232|nr:hypothetical protein [Streptomyces sp. NBC_00243]WRZ20913.1 hypothetical protein OHT59_21595 [Streptomyces sp. NBC_00243]
MQKRTRAALLAASAGAFMVMGISPASADTYDSSCSSTGVVGSLYTTGWDYNEKTIPYVSLAVSDSLADGHHVAVRLVTVGQTDDDVTYFPWHHYYGGQGGATAWETSATTARPIAGFRLEAARFEGSTLLNYCAAKAA